MGWVKQVRTIARKGESECVLCVSVRERKREREWMSELRDDREATD